MTLILRGLIIGLVIAAPVGPIGVLCIHRTLTAGRINGFVSGLGAATADAVYGSIAALGLTLVSSFLIEQQLWFRIVGGIFLCGLGIKTAVSKAAKKPHAVGSKRLAVAYGSTFLLTLMNPMTLLAFTAAFASFGITSSGYGSAGLLIAGVFTGSCIWWVFLSSAAGLFRHKLTYRNAVWINRISGIVMTTFGVLLLISLFV